MARPARGRADAARSRRARRRAAARAARRGPAGSTAAGRAARRARRQRRRRALGRRPAARRGVQVDRGAARPSTVARRGPAAAARAGGRVVDATVSRGHGWRARRADLVGRRAAGHRRRGRAATGRRPTLRASAADGPVVVAVDLPERRRPRHRGARSRPVPWPTSPSPSAPPSPACCCRRPPRRRRVDLVDIGLDPAGPRPPCAGSSPPTCAPGGRCRESDDDKYSRGVVGVVAGGADLHRRRGARDRCRGPRRRRDGALPRPGRGDRPGARPLARGGPGARPGAGVGARARASTPTTEGQAEHVRTALAGEEPCLVDAGALALLPGLPAAPATSRRRCCSPRTPASWRGCSPTSAPAPTAAPSRPTR